MALSDFLANLLQGSAQGAAPQASAPLAAPVADPTAAQPMPQNYTDFVQRLLAASAAQRAAGGLFSRSIPNRITGNDVTAANANINAAAPGAWQTYQTGQDALQNKQLGTMEAFAAPQAMTGVPIDPNNPMASTSAYANALRGYLTSSQGQPDPQAAIPTPASQGGPGPQGQNAPQAAISPMIQPQAASTDPTAPMRALVARQMALRAAMGDTQGVQALSSVANTGRPDNTVVGPTGAFIPATVATPNGAVPAQTFNARGAGMTSAAQAAGTASQTPVQVVGRQGPMTVSQADLLKNGGAQMGSDGQPTWLAADSPQFKTIQGSQQSDLKTLKDSAVQSQATGNTATQLYNAANELPPGGTGQFGALKQQWRKIAIGALQAAGANVDPHLANDAAAFEKMNFQGLNFVQASAHGFSPRAALQIVKMIQAVKPGDKTTSQGIKQIITQEVMPGVMRDQAMFGQANDYYNKNPLATDAMTAIPGKNPIGSFNIKNVNTAQPGDYFVDPRDGRLRQRTVQ